ncbi:MAG: hypothetical protein CML06_17595 [Pseudomonadales bacterium]|nr:hypothetical protein [Pseudomonadales bacterium]
MKLVVKMLIFMVILGLAGPYLLLGPDGMQKLMQIRDQLPAFELEAPDLNDAKELVTGSDAAQPWIQWSKGPEHFQPDRLTREQLAMLDIQAQANIFYRWQDDNGVWQFSEMPNPNTDNIVVRTDPDANVLQGMTEEQIDAAFGRVKQDTSNSITKNNPLANGEGLEDNLPVPTTIPMKEIPKLIDQAKDVQRIMEQRMERMEMSLGAPAE